MGRFLTFGINATCLAVPGLGKQLQPVDIVYVHFSLTSASYGSVLYLQISRTRRVWSKFWGRSPLRPRVSLQRPLQLGIDRRPLSPEYWHRHHSRWLDIDFYILYEVKLSTFHIYHSAATTEGKQGSLQPQGNVNDTKWNILSRMMTSLPMLIIVV